MARKKEFGEGLIYTITNYIWWFLLGSFYFAVTNILFLIVWFGAGSQAMLDFNVITIISLLPAGPAFVALLSAMGKLVREKDINMTREFFKSYKKNFFEALFYWGIFITALSILYVDFMFFNTKLQLSGVKIILLALTFVVISIMFYVFPIVSRFYLKVKDVFRISLYMSIKKINITILNWACLVGLSYVYIKTFNPVLFIFFWSILAYLIMLNEKVILEQIEEKYLTQKTEGQ
jgi:uncharacterized membrane protein YesL